MTWDQVRTLHRPGFDIGAHTRTHADLGPRSTAPPRAKRFSARGTSSSGSSAAPVDLFAYPYGGRGT